MEKNKIPTAAKKACLNLDGQTMTEQYFISAYDSCGSEQEFRVDQQSIINAYPKDNIK